MKTNLIGTALVVALFGAGAWFAGRASVPAPTSGNYSASSPYQSLGSPNSGVPLPPSPIGPPGPFGVQAIQVPMLPVMIGPPIGGTGVVAGIDVIGHNPSGLLAINRSATTTSFPVPRADESLDASTMRIVSINPFVFVQKPDGVHIEYVYDSGIAAPGAATTIPKPLPHLVPGAVVFSENNNVRVYGLGDGGVVAGLPASDTLRFATSSARYLVDARGVYFLTYAASLMQTAGDFTVVRVQSADPDTFSVLYPDANFARDATHYFMNGKLITDMTPQTAPPLSYSAYSDGTWLYQVGFVKDSGEQYTGVRYRDTGTITKKLLKDVYYKKIADVDTANYQYTQYAIKPDGVRYGAMKVAGADSASFELVVGLTDLFSRKGGVSYEYARDNAHVYYQGVQIPDADRETFLPVASNPAYGTDRSHVFLSGVEIPGADPSTFAPLWFPIYEGCSVGMYARDARQVFYKSQAVEGADPESFKALYGEYGRDARGIYFQGIFHPEINPKSFTGPECNYG